MWQTQMTIFRYSASLSLFNNTLSYDNRENTVTRIEDQLQMMHKN